MLVEATHAGCRWFSLLICTYLHDILAVHLFNAGLPCMASSRAIARTQPVASVIHRIPCEAVPLSFRPLCENLPFVHPRVGQGWYRGGPGLERVWNGMERGLERNGPLQHSCHHAAHLYQPRSATLSKLADWSESRLPAGWQLASASLPDSTIKHHSRAAAGSNCKWCRRKPATGWEGGRVTSNPFLDCQLATAKRIPTITQQSR